MQEHEQDLHEEHQEDPWYKKYFLYFIGIVLLILTVSLGFSPIMNIFEGQLDSTPLENNQLDADNINIEFKNDIAQRFQELFIQEEGKEWSACLKGEIQQDNYIITDFYIPKIFSRSFGHVQFEPCDKDTLVLFHTHPYKSCLASDQDIQTLKQSKEKNPDIIAIIMCEPGRFSVYE